ncbi:MAG: EAL domain-containing protein [Turicibacter sp.]|nr:EAL domain-containing protein [Turicibacter sp.]
MNNAIKNKEFRIVYQPKFDAKTKKVIGAEALIRWVKSDNSMVYPDQFIPIAEKTGFITFIDSYVFREVCEKQVEWSQKGYNIVPISLNVSREKLKDQHFLYEYLKIIGEAGLKKEYIQLEITEGDTYSYDHVQSNIVDLIKDSGFKVLIDDFGVGYSSLTMLKKIKADFLKLDRSFIVDESNEGKAMVNYISKIARIFNYRIIAEGVETQEQYDYVKEYCDEIQGYYFSKPLEEEEFVNKYLKSRLG